MRYKDGLGAEVEPAAARLYLRLGPSVAAPFRWASGSASFMLGSSESKPRGVERIMKG
jgi:hypothetical protein